jgi:hypothetical protein
MKYLLLACLTLVGCAGWTPHSWLVNDYKTHHCYTIYSSPLYIDGRIHWTNLQGESVSSSDSFDIRVVQDENYQAAADSMNIPLEQCSNGLR